MGFRLTTKTSGGVVKWWHRLTPAERIPAAAVREEPSLLRTGMIFFRTRVPSTVAQALAGGTPTGHCGLVEGWHDGRLIATVEANTNGGDSAVGNRVVAKANLSIIDDPRLLGFGLPSYVRA